MSGIEIKYCIENLDSAPFEDETERYGSLSVTKDGLILTKMIDDPEDEGFCGDIIYYNMSDWLYAVPKLCNGERYELDLLDSQEGFLLIPEEEFTYFKYFVGGTGSVYDWRNRKSMRIEDINKRYPNHEKGTPIKTD